VDDALTHNEADAFERGDVVERAGRHGDDVRLLAGLERADLPGAIQPAPQQVVRGAPRSVTTMS
jgi:hypothetical protein